MKKKILATVLTLALSLPAVMASAQSTDQEVTVMGSGLQVTQTSLNFQDIILNVKQAQNSTAKSDLFVLDGRGTDAGWGVSLKATDFVLKKTVNEQEVLFTIPSSAVVITTHYKKAVVGTPVDFQAGEGVLATAQPLSAVESRIVGVKPASGAGTHEFGLDYRLSLPKTIQGSDGSSIGVLQGTYSSVFTYTVTAGI